MLRGFCWSRLPNIVSWPESSASWPPTSRSSSPDGPSASRASARVPPRRRSAIEASQHVADRHAALQETRRLARRHQVAPGEALVDRLQHVEQHQAGDEVGREPGQPLDLAAAHAAVDLLGRRQQAERAAQHVLADQRRRRRQARRQRDAPVVERAVDRRMAEGDQGDGAAGPRRELALAQAHQRVEAAPRQSLDAADEEERLTGEGHRLARYPRAALRAAGFLGAGLRAASLAAGASAVLLGARGRRTAPSPPAASRLFFSASMMLTTLAGCAGSGTVKVWPCLLGAQHGDDGLLVAVGEGVGLEVARHAVDDLLGDVEHLGRQLHVADLVEDLAARRTS